MEKEQKAGELPLNGTEPASEPDEENEIEREAKEVKGSNCRQNLVDRRSGEHPVLYRKERRSGKDRRDMPKKAAHPLKHPDTVVDKIATTLSSLLDKIDDKLDKNHS